MKKIETTFFENCINHSDSGWVTAFTGRVWADPEDYTSAASFAHNLCVPVFFAKKRTLPLAAAAPLITMVTTKADPNAEKSADAFKKVCSENKYLNFIVAFLCCRGLAFCTLFWSPFTECRSEVMFGYPGTIGQTSTGGTRFEPPKTNTPWSTLAVLHVKSETPLTSLYQSLLNKNALWMLCQSHADSFWQIKTIQRPYLLWFAQLE